jgi:hypothetical protein
MRATARLALLAVLVACAFSALAPGQASAFTGYYNCILKPVGQWCDGRANGTYDGLRSWDYNEGWYPGIWPSPVTVCQRLYRPSTGGTLAGSSCNGDATGVHYGNITCVCYEAHVRQYSGGPHSVNGEADDNF